MTVFKNGLFYNIRILFMNLKSFKMRNIDLVNMIIESALWV